MPAAIPNAGSRDGKHSLDNPAAAANATTGITGARIRMSVQKTV